MSRPTPRGRRSAVAFGTAAVTALLALRLAVPDAVAGAAAPPPAQEPPAWAFPQNPLSPGGRPPPDARVLQRLPGSRVQYTQAQLVDLFGAPDWHPESHDPMPPVVAQGRKPDLFACGYCHLPGGQGRPENAAIAGLPQRYIVEQLAAMASGERRSAWPGPWVPHDLMLKVAQDVTPAEAEAAAAYFSKQVLPPRVRVLERARVPRSHVSGYMHIAEPGAGDEPLDGRLLEFTTDLRRHEMRDPRMLYVAYVPPGSIARGRAIAHSGGAERGNACETCHGPALRGTALAPPIAGRMPGYLLRQLLAFQAGARHSVAALPMRVVALELDLPAMIDAVAYAASLPP